MVPGDPAFPTSLFELTSALLGSATGSNPVYAVDANGGIVDGWPVEVGVAAGDLLPLVLPGHDAAVLDSDGDGDDEVSVSAATSVMPGGARLVGRRRGPRSLRTRTHQARRSSTTARS